MFLFLYNKRVSAVIRQQVCLSLLDNSGISTPSIMTYFFRDYIFLVWHLLHCLTLVLVLSSHSSVKALLWYPLRFGLWATSLYLVQYTTEPSQNSPANDHLMQTTLN